MTLQVGDIEDGYQYIGGPPDDAKSWVAESKLSREMEHPPSQPRPDILGSVLPMLERGGGEALGGAGGALVGAGLGPVGALAGGVLGTMAGSEAIRLKQQAMGGDPPGVSQSILSGLEAPAIGRVGQLAGAAARWGLTPGRNAPAAARLNMLEQFGLPPQLSAVTDRPAHRLLWEANTFAPSARKTVTDWEDKLTAGMAREIEAAAGPRAGSIYLAGQELRAGADITTKKFWDTADGMRRTYNAALGKNKPAVDVTKYAEALGGVMQKYGPEQARAYGASKVMQRIDALSKRYGIYEGEQLVGLKPVPWDEADSIRKAVGQDIGKAKKTGSFQDIGYKELQGHYAAMTESMEDALEASGNDAAMRAWNRQKTYFRRGAKVMEGIVDPITKKADPERFMTAFFNTKSHSEARRHWAAIPRAQRERIRGEVVSQLGVATPGVQGAGGDTFSVATFLTNYNKMGPENRKLLFGRSPGKKDLESLAEVAEWVKEAQRVANTSRTAHMAGFLGQATQFGGLGAASLLVFDPSTAIGAAFTGTWGTRKIAKLMVDPSFVRWAVQGRRFAPTSRGWTEHIAKLAGLPGLQGVNKDIAESLQAKLLDMTSSDVEQPPEVVMGEAQTVTQ